MAVLIAVPKFNKFEFAKDIVDCDAALLAFRRRDALRNVVMKMTKQKKHHDYTELEKKHTSGICLHVALWNTYVARYKQRYCPPHLINLNTTQEIFRHAAGFANAESRMKTIFRKGGWTDIDYCPVGRCKKEQH